MAYKEINETTRAAVIARLFAGSSPTEISRETGVSEATISRLKRNIPQEVLKKFEAEREKLQAERNAFEAEKRCVVSLVEKHLEASLEACVNVMMQTQDAEWLAKQSADQLAILYGIATDKAVRILGALERADERRAALPSPNSPPSPPKTSYALPAVNRQ